MRATLLAVAIAAATSACSPAPIAATIRGGFPQEIETVAVLPFANLTESTGAPRVVEQALVASLERSSAFSVLEPGRVTRFLRNHRAVRAGGIQPEVAQMMWEALDADGLVSGTVIGFRNEVGVAGRRVPMIEVATRLIDARTGLVVWSGYWELDGADRISVFEIGRVWTVAELATVIADESVASMASPDLVFKRPAPRTLRAVREENATIGAKTEKVEEREAESAPVPPAEGEPQPEPEAVPEPEAEADPDAASVSAAEEGEAAPSGEDAPAVETPTEAAPEIEVGEDPGVE